MRLGLFSNLSSTQTLKTSAKDVLLEKGGWGGGDRKPLCLNFVSEDLVNIYGSLCPSSRGIRNRKVLLEYPEYMKMFSFDDDFSHAAQSSQSTEKKHLTLFLWLFMSALSLIWTPRVISRPTLPLNFKIPSRSHASCRRSKRKPEKKKPVTSPWCRGLKIITPFLLSQSSPLLLQPWYCNANTIALDWIRETTSCEMEPGLTTRPISHVNATRVHSARHNRMDTTQ